MIPPRMGTLDARPLVRTIFLAGCAVGAMAPEIHAQAVSFSGRPEGEAQARLARFLETESYTVWTRDTVLSREDRVTGHLVILEGEVRIAGHVEGDIYVVDGVLFLRPGARIDGKLLVLGGGFYGSSLAEVRDGVTYRPTERLRVLPEGGGWVIFGAEEPLPAFGLDGLSGFLLPIYQRVDAVTVGWGATARALAVPWRPDLQFAVRFKTARSRLEGSVRQLWHPSRRLSFGVEAGRATVSNDDWIRREWINSLYVLVAGEDYRNYYEADRIGLVLELETPDRLRFRLGGRWEKARSLEARGIFALFADSLEVARPNPPVDDGEIVGLLASAEWERGDRRSRMSLRVALEGASADLAGDFSFLRGEAQAELRLPIVGRHAVELWGIARGDLAGRLPRQRWSALGGIGTLPPFPILGMRGERLLFAEATYVFSLLDIARLGSADLLVRGSLGSAWSEGDPFRTEESVSFAARVLGLELGASYGAPALPYAPRWVVYLDVRLPRGPRVP